MKFNKHYELRNIGHAFLSPSAYHWLNYDVEKLKLRYSTWEAAKVGTELHAFASEAIRLGIKLPKSRKTLNMFVNDAIGYRMDTEMTLFYSFNCYGTADALSFRKNYLRISDLKTGVTPSSMNQLLVYAALFCLEYSVKPHTIETELRIYQNDEIILDNPDPEMIVDVMNTIVEFDRYIDEWKGVEE